MFKLGDKVHCSFWDKDGTVIDIENPESDTFPIVVLFNNEESDCYTEDGKWNTTQETTDLTLIS